MSNRDICPDCLSVLTDRFVDEYGPSYCDVCDREVDREQQTPDEDTSTDEPSGNESA